MAKSSQIPRSNALLGFLVVATGMIQKAADKPNGYHSSTDGAYPTML